MSDELVYILEELTSPGGLREEIDRSIVDNLINSMNELVEERAKSHWNSEADDYNKWDDLGQDEKDTLILLAKNEMNQYKEA